MHRLAAIPGGWSPDREGVVFIDQTPAPIVVLSAADTDIQTLAAALAHLPSDFPAVRVASLLNLQQNLTIDTYAETVLAEAKIIVLRVLGGRSYWAYGLEVLQELVSQTSAALLVLPGDARPDPNLTSLSTVPLAVVNQVWHYWLAGGAANLAAALQVLTNHHLGTVYNPPLPQAVANVGQYEWQNDAELAMGSDDRKTVAILFYRAHYLAGNLTAIAALCQALADRHLHPLPLYVSSLRDPDVQAELLQYLQPKQGRAAQLVLNTTSFAIADLSDSIGTPVPGAVSVEAEPCQAFTGNPCDRCTTPFWCRLNLPVLQVIFSGGTEDQWRSQTRGLSPRDMAMNVVLPEVDGRVITRAVSFKAVQMRNPQLETDVVTYEPVGDRIQFVADLARNWLTLRHTPPAQRKVALILANYPNRDGRIANGVGLDTPESCLELLRALQQAGYRTGTLPRTSNDLMQHLMQGRTNDPESALRPVAQSLSLHQYQQFLASLPTAVQQSMGDRRGDPAIRCAQASQSADPTQPADLGFAIAGIQLGNIFVGIQPARSDEPDPTLSYHAPDLEPTHEYLAFYAWVRSQFGAQAIVHVGKHGNLEWLPGNSIALSQQCYPEVALGPLPHFYPFIVNDPGEGCQAKRRSQAVIVDHLTPPMTRAELYDNLHQLERLMDEYYDAQTLDPVRLPLLRERILTLIQQEHLEHDLTIRAADITSASIETYFPVLDGYLCELKEAQIRDGLHVLGQCPGGQRLRDLALAIARAPSAGRMGLTRAIAEDWGWPFDPLTAELGQPFDSLDGDKLPWSEEPAPRTVGGAIAQLESHAADLIDRLIAGEDNWATPLPATQRELHWIATDLLPALHRTSDELTHLLRGLAGGYIPPGASGAPTRNRPDVLPTGRNFYSVDIRGLPTETAWDLGRKAAETLVERYTQENGDYPQTLGLSVWGTSTMRTGGDDLAEALALLGVRPVWEGAARRVVDIEVLPLSLLGRPRVDVTLRVSGFFRDAFANLIQLFDHAVQVVAELDEPADMNPLATRVQQETQTWMQQGIAAEVAEARSRYRIFGSPPGAYGAGLQGLIDSQAWQNQDDLARAYLNWSSYAYTSANSTGVAAPEAFQQRLQQMQVVLQNQDNREHDLLDSDDYYQFQGGLAAAVQSLRGERPMMYFGDHANPEQPKIRQLSEEIARVYRSRVVNPKWIAGALRHGYKGAAEMAATVDFLFAYDATTATVEDFMYQGIAQAYVLDPAVQTVVQVKNPWALRDMAERLLEAHQRGLWQQADAHTLAQLRTISLEAECQIEQDGLGR
jgi:cobaltochelatase CobN